MMTSRVLDPFVHQPGNHPYGYITSLVNCEWLHPWLGAGPRSSQAGLEDDHAATAPLIRLDTTALELPAEIWEERMGKLPCCRDPS